MRFSFIAAAALAAGAVVAAGEGMAKLDHALDDLKDHVDLEAFKEHIDAKLTGIKGNAENEGMALHAKLEGELEDAAAKSRAERAAKLQKLQRTPGVLRGVRGNFMDFEGPNGPLDPQNLQDKATPELPLGSVEPQLDQVRYSLDYILVLDSSDKQIAFGPAAQIKATYPKLVIVDEFDDNKVIVPGFIDTHTHYPQTNIIAAPGQKLEEWLAEFIIPGEARYCDVKETAEQTAEFYLRRMLKAGTTTVVSFATSRRTSVDAFFNVAKRLNLRTATGLTGWDLLSKDYPGIGGLNDGWQNTAEEFEAVTEDLYKTWHKNGRLMYALTPRWQPASSSKFLATVSKLWKKYQPNGAFLLTHLLETRNERDVSTPDLFTGTNGRDPYFPVPGAKDMYGVFQAFNLTGPRAIMGHTVWATEDEYDRMNQDGTVIAHCPASNSYLGSGDFKTPYVAAQKGIKWTIGNDMGGGNYYNMLKVLGDAYKVGMLQGQGQTSNASLPVAYPTSQSYNYNTYALSGIMAMYLPSAATARALDLYDKLGSFTPGKEADFAVFDVNPASVPELGLRNLRFGALPINGNVTKLESALFGMFNLCDDRCTVATYSGGRKLYDRVLGELNP